MFKRPSVIAYSCLLSGETLIFTSIFDICFVSLLGVVHEHPRIGSDGESEEGSGTSEDPNVSPGSGDSAASQNNDVTGQVWWEDSAASQNKDVTEQVWRDDSVASQNNDVTGQVCDGIGQLHCVLWDKWLTSWVSRHHMDICVWRHRKCFWITIVLWGQWAYMWPN